MVSVFSYLSGAHFVSVVFALVVLLSGGGLLGCSMGLGGVLATVLSRWVKMMGFYLSNLLGLLGNDGGFGSWLCHGLRLVVPVD